MDLNYNNGRAIDYRMIKESDYDDALTQFSEGSEALRMCLQVLWGKKLFTRSCCRGNHFEVNSDAKLNVNSNAYIGFQEGIDIFSYLSLDILSDPYLFLSERNGRQIIYYYGTNKNIFFYSLAYDVLKGKKNNRAKLAKKVQIEPSRAFILRAYIDNLREHNVSDELLSVIEGLKRREFEILDNIRVCKQKEMVDNIMEELNNNNKLVEDMLRDFIISREYGNRIHK